MIKRGWKTACTIIARRLRSWRGSLQHPFSLCRTQREKKQLIINTLVFEIHTEVFDEYGDELPVNRRFTANRINRFLTMADFDGGGAEQSMTLDGKKMSTLLRWAVHSLEIFMWPEDYDLAPSRNSIPPYFDLLPEYWPDKDEETGEDLPDEDVPERDVCWRVQIEYANHTTQEIVSHQDYLIDRPEELYLALLEYFELETTDFDEKYVEIAPLE